MTSSSFSVTTPNGVIQAGDTVVARIQNRRGYKINLPQPLAPGELGWCIDTKELFIGLDSSTSSSSITVTDQVEVQRLLDEEMIECQSKWSYLNGTVTGSVDNGGSSLTEEDFIRNYLAMSPEDFINGTSVIADVEDNVFVLTQFKNAIASSVPAGLQPEMVRVTTTESTAVGTAKIIITSIVGGVITGYSAAPDVLVDSDAGLGYFDGDIVEIPNGAGTNATFSITVLDDGQGKVTTFNLLSGGTGYAAIAGNTKFTVTGPDLSSKTAVAGPTTISGGELTSVPLISGGGEYRTKPIVDVNGGSAVVNAVVEAIWDNVTRTVTGLTIVSVGSGYVSAPSVTIRDPLSKVMYKFRYDLGLPTATPTDITNANAAFNAVDDLTFPLSKLIDSVANSQSQLLGAGGQGKAVIIDSSGQAVLVMDTPNQASATTTIINEINSSSASLAQSSQNVEVLTEYSTLPTAPPSVIIPTEDLESGQLVATGANTWTNVEIDDKDNPGNTIVLAYDPLDSNSIFLKFSAKHSSGDTFLRNGFMNIVVYDGVTDLTTSSTEVKAPALSGNNIYFRTFMVTGQAVLQYWHTFPNDVELKFASTEWLA